MLTDTVRNLSISSNRKGQPVAPCAEHFYLHLTYVYIVHVSIDARSSTTNGHFLVHVSQRLSFLLNDETVGSTTNGHFLVHFLVHVSQRLSFLLNDETVGRQVESTSIRNYVVHHSLCKRAARSTNRSAMESKKGQICRLADHDRIPTR